MAGMCHNQPFINQLGRLAYWPSERQVLGMPRAIENYINEDKVHRMIREVVIPTAGMLAASSIGSPLVGKKVIRLKNLIALTHLPD